MTRLFDLSQSEPVDPEFDVWYSWPYDHQWDDVKWASIWIGVVFLLCMIASCYHQPALTREYMDEQIAQAIKKAENPVGSGKAFTYGITSVPCSSEVQCHGIVIRTISRNRKRYGVSGLRGSEDFIAFLQQRYCPDTQGSCSSWYKNVTYFLKKDNP